MAETRRRDQKREQPVETVPIPQEPVEEIIEPRVSAILIGYLTSRPGFIGYCDATDTKSNTLSENTQQLIKGMGDDPIEVTTYINFLDRTYGRDQPSQRNADMDRWEPYIRFKSNIKFRYVYYYDSVLSEPNFYKWMKGKTNKEIVEMRTKAYKMDINTL